MGRAFVYPDPINTDLLAPGHLMKLSPEELASHCLEALDPDFASSVKPGDIVVNGPNFGLGSSREQAAVSLKVLGVGALLAPSFARIFYRNAINIGLPAIVFPQALEIRDGDEVTVDAGAGLVTNHTQGRTYAVAAIPPNLMTMIEAGGLIPYTTAKLAAARAEAAAL
jgi:3-isopropylmalate/(R)-2-methylmalate dehydratase small subunit